MVDDFDGPSPWDDQVSHGSSSTSLHKATDNTDEPIDQPNGPPVVELEPPTLSLHPDLTAPPPDTLPSTKSGPRRNRIRKPVHPVTVEPVEADPLGPLGASPDETGGKPDPSMSTDSLKDVPLDSEAMASLSLGPEPAKSRPRSWKSAEPTQRQPQWRITVGDPIKVGDITSAHTVYTVHSKHEEGTEHMVTRRYRDFLWVCHALQHNNPGVIVPPPPEKQAVGRFDEDFVEQRRAALENMLAKVARHPDLQRDPDFLLFLSSEQLASDIKDREASQPFDETRAAAASGSAVPGGSAGSSSGGSIMSTLGGAFSFSGKFVETNDWFVEKKHYVDTLEAQLKSLAKALDLVVAQRRELSDTTAEFAGVVAALADVEVSRSLSDLLANFAQAQYRIRDLYARQAMQDVLSLATTLDEYVRLIGSIRAVFGQRQNLYVSAQAAEQELAKRHRVLEKLQRQGKTQQDKILGLQEQAAVQEKLVVTLKVAFDDITKHIIAEFEAFEHDKVADFRNSVELFLENAVEAQKEAIEVWETFYQLAGYA